MKSTGGGGRGSGTVNSPYRASEASLRAGVASSSPERHSLDTGAQPNLFILEEKLGSGRGVVRMVSRKGSVSRIPNTAAAIAEARRGGLTVQKGNAPIAFYSARSPAAARRIDKLIMNRIVNGR